MQFNREWRKACIFIGTGLALSAAPAFGQAVNSFTYQGRLENGGTPADGLHDFHFRLFNAIVEGSQVGTTICVDNVSVTDGLFSVTLNFGQQFVLNPRFLEIDVRPDTGLNCSNATGFTLLGPRQLITATPLAMHANAAFSLDASDGSPTNAVVVDTDGLTRINGGLTVFGNVSTSSDAFVAGNARVEGGIGVGTVPSTSLHVRTANPVLILQDRDISTLQSGYIGFWNDNPTETAWVGFGTPGNSDFSVVNARAGGDIVLSPISASGQVGIATGDPEFLLHVAGSAGKPGGGSWSSASDARLKKNITPLEGALQRMLALRGVTYEYVDPAAIHELPGVQIGMIAQEVEEVFPAWVDQARSGHKCLTFRGFEALTVEALREMKSLADADAAKLRTEVATLRDENTELRRRLEALETTLARLVR